MKIINFEDSAKIILHGDIIDDTDAEWLGINDENVIGFCFPAKVREALDQLKGKPIEVHIASDGGNVGAGVAIYNMLSAHDAPVEVYVDAWAASIASVIAMAGQKIFMPANTFLMLHNPQGGAFGEASYLHAVADWLDKIRTMIAETYAKNSDKSVEEFFALMDKETWLTASEASEVFSNVEIIEDDSRLEAVAHFSEKENAPAEVNEKTHKMFEIEAKDQKTKDILAVVKRSLEL